MRIAHLSPDYPFTALYRRFLLASAALGRDEHLMHVPCERGREVEHLQRCEASGVEIAYSHDFDRWQRFFYTHKRAAIIEGFRRTHGDRRFDLFYAHYLFSAGGPAAELARDRGVPYVCAVRNADRNTFLRWAPHLRPLGRKLLQNAGAIVFLAPNHRDAVIEDLFGPDSRPAMVAKSRVIPNGISDFWHDHPKMPRDRVPSVVRILYAGDFDRNKNLRGTLAAALRLRREGVEVRLTFVGDGPERPWALAQAGRFPSMVSVRPRIAGEAALAETLAEHDLFVMPSFRETFGMIYIEALSQGVPIVWTKGQGIDGWFPEGSVGASCDPADPASITAAIRRILGDYAAMSARARPAVLPFRWSDVARDTADLYRAVTGRS